VQGDRPDLFKIKEKINLMDERLEFRRLQEENAILKAEITAYKVQNSNLHNSINELIRLNNESRK
jgi:hypothetical protein